MLSLFRIHSSPIVSTLRAFALLALTALGACDSPAGVFPGDCSYEASRCPGLEVFSRCTAPGTCTVDGALAVCDQGHCSLSPGQKLTVQLASAELTGATPDLEIHFATGAPTPEEVHVLIDGVEIAGETEPGSADILVKWTSSAISPQALELSFSSKGIETTEVEASFQNLQCEIDDQLSCHGGGG
jgi:hypothetical protein